MLRPVTPLSSLHVSKTTGGTTPGIPQAPLCKHFETRKCTVNTIEQFFASSMQNQKELHCLACHVTGLENNNTWSSYHSDCLNSQCPLTRIITESSLHLSNLNTNKRKRRRKRRTMLQERTTCKT